MLTPLVQLIKDNCDNAIKSGIFGNQSFHIEKVCRIEDDGKALCFEVTTWNDQSTRPRQTKKMYLVELMDLIGKTIAYSATRDAVGVVEKLT